MGSLIQTGCSMVLRSKFSKSQFVRDVRKYNCTIMQYIGELCRYLLAAPVTNYDSDTSLRLAIGNGLRPDIWVCSASSFLSLRSLFIPFLIVPLFDPLKLVALLWAAVV